ncbi:MULTISPECIES: MarR family winged helix-turn-helix transcriptional regulator [Paenibacillus]|uniref:MarR family transcriptional regulator n=1 Tax=Paenibacillus campinasensis TaxID=66347 RepID=A0A268EMT9_9BACL|nr:MULTISPECIES: MarR family transcriptional regulator [Paenibacillus]MUG66977.1 MarR family transcriptional regulator [Paenibacillus campinasensis]PAD74434.1 MarR family transcriptional regulator [Paenibacillus campinasensis]PAK50832.1 MarR family transcriptional regulator [Paenibacillus sp. 7541]
MSIQNDILEVEMLFKKMLRTVQSEWQKEGFPKLGRSQFTTLEKLNELGAMRLSDVADTIHVTGGAVTGISDKLIEGGYARRVRDSQDRRVVYLEITDQGRELIRQLDKKRAELSELLYGFLTEEEIRQLRIIYRKIIENIETIHGQVGSDD